MEKMKNMKNMKKTRFSNHICVKYIMPNKYRPILLYKNLIYTNFLASKTIFNIINQYSRFKFPYPISDDFPIKIYSIHLDWYNDDSAIVLLNEIRNNKYSLATFISEFNSYVLRYLKNPTYSKIKYQSVIKNFIIEIPFLF